MTETKQPGGKVLGFFAEFDLVEWVERSAERENRTVSNFLNTLAREAKKKSEEK